MKVLSWLAFLWAFSVSDGRKACSPGRYWDSGLDKCDLCSSICDFMEQQGTAKACQESCPDYKSVADANQANEQSIVNGTSMIVPVVVCAIVGVICSIIVAGFLLRRHRQRHTDAPSDEPTPQPPPLPHSSVTYVALPIHTQTEDTATSASSIGASADRREGIEANLMGYPDLPDRFEPIGDDISPR
ncbi:uncharacterized protein LOC124259287 [Haliotis rubra]|uniref:uncharacterized protein LOC124259287 n=1 Tax=Haliotis rubra TaxID=36100 RepID=UPI001EE5B765|nr:uncharacterized protein LOC124259287 [Haliotis rubra]